MIVTPEYCRMMARYNAWQNDQMYRAMERLSEADLAKARGAFWGSILGTANHLLWADAMWMARFERSAPPEVTLKDSAAMCPTLAAWEAERFRLDGRITIWAERVGAVDLAGDLSWYSSVLKCEMKVPMGQAVAHVFNHQTHHRGQIHALLGQAGGTDGLPVTDLPFMPDAG